MDADETLYYYLRNHSESRRPFALSKDPLRDAHSAALTPRCGDGLIGIPALAYRPSRHRHRHPSWAWLKDPMLNGFDDNEAANQPAITLGFPGT